MAGPYRVDLLFNTLNGPPAGWAETFYWNNTTSINTAMTNFINSQVYALRKNLLTPDYWIFGIRLTDVSVSRSVLVKYNIPATDTGGFPVTPNAANSTPPFVALKLIASFTGSRSRAYHLRGLPQGVVSLTYQYLPNQVPGFKSLLDMWRQALAGAPVTGTPVLLAKRFNMPSPFVATQPITAVNPFIPNQLFIPFSVQTVPPITQPGPLSAPVLVRLKDFSGVDWVNKVWRVFKLDPGTAPNNFIVTTLPHKQIIVGATPYGSGQISLQTFTYPNCTSLVPVEGVYKKTGRPFGELRGRRGVIHG